MKNLVLASVLFFAFSISNNIQAQEKEKTTSEKEKRKSVHEQKREFKKNIPTAG